GKAPALACGFKVDGNARAPGDLTAGDHERFGEVKLLQFARTQIPDGAAQLDLALMKKAAGEFQRLAGIGGISLEKFRGGIELERDAGERLFERVMQFASEPGAFGQDGAELN